MKRLAYFFDGTWADPTDSTNVSQLKKLVAPIGPNGTKQLAEYDPGVGSKWNERLRGGMFGFGLLDNVTDGYRWLASHYEEEDEVFIFGYSRGAFTARSLAGVIARCGLLHSVNDDGVERVIARYKKGKGATARYELEWLSDEEKARLPAEDRWLLEPSRAVDIQFIGVWDTVGALGVPFGNLPGISRRSQQFHNTNPSVTYKNMFQALAIDENRKPFDATLWTDFQEPGQAPPELKPDQRLEQRWFAGSHSNIGGGGSKNTLARIPLAWLQQMAAEAGLSFTKQVTPNPTDHRGDVRDSYRFFLKRTYPLLRIGRGRHWREVGRQPRPTTTRPGTSYTLNETIDASVFDRWRDTSNYRPRNLVDWGKTAGKDPGSVHGTMEA